MTFWLRSNVLGRLEVLEVYAYYDRPVLLACRNASDGLYLAVLAEETSTAEDWLCVAVSLSRLQYVRSGGIDLHTAFAAPEDGIVYHFSVPNDESSRITFDSVSAGDISPEWLPAPNAKLELPTTTLPKLAHDIKTEAVQSRRDLLEITLDPIGVTRNEAPASLIGRVLTSIQDFITSLARTPHRKGSAAAAQDAMKSHELMFLAVGGGSFELKLASQDTA